MAWPSPHDWKEMRAFLTDETDELREIGARSTPPFLRAELRQLEKLEPEAAARSAVLTRRTRVE